MSTTASCHRGEDTGNGAISTRALADPEGGREGVLTAECGVVQADTARSAV